MGRGILAEARPDGIVLCCVGVCFSLGLTIHLVSVRPGLALLRGEMVVWLFVCLFVVCLCVSIREAGAREGDGGVQVLVLISSRLDH